MDDGEDVDEDNGCCIGANGNDEVEVTVGTPSYTTDSGVVDVLEALSVDSTSNASITNGMVSLDKRQRFVDRDCSIPVV